MSNNNQRLAQSLNEIKRASDSLPDAVKRQSRLDGSAKIFEFGEAKSISKNESDSGSNSKTEKK